MTANTPISPDAFATELASLDSDAFATLVGETYAATADGVDVDAPRVAVSEGGRRTELLVVTAAERDASAVGVDAVVVASDALLDGLGSEHDADVVTPADLRERLLYAVPPAEANAIADRTLGVPVRSRAYEDATVADSGRAADGADETSGPDEASGPDEGAANVGSADATGDVTGADAADDATGADAAGVSSPPTRSAAGGLDSAPTDPSAPGSGSGPPSPAVDASSDRRSPRTVLAAVAVAALLVASAVAGFAAGTAGIGNLDGGAGTGDDDAEGSAGNSDATAPTDGSDAATEESTGDGDANTAAVAEDDPTGEAARNTAPSPTCDRSALQVVQIQLNALRYNDDETNDGIRTLRAFASPENREVVGSVDQYVEMFETPRYAPMLTYDTARYSVPEIADGTAELTVVTRENGSVTGRYEFRLVRVDGGSGEADGSLGDVDDCWMTDGVTSSTE